MRFQGCHQYGSIPLLTYWCMPILLNLEWHSDTGYTSREYTTYWIFSVRIQRNSQLFLPNRSIHKMTWASIYISGPTRLNKCELITYMKHIFESYNSSIELPDDPFHPISPDKWTQHTPTQMKTYLIQSLPNPHGPEPIPSGPISSARPTGYSPAAIELI